MINYWKKNIQFAVYDCPVDHDFLTNYFIEEINIVHIQNKISIIFSKKNAIPAIGIFLEKWNSIDDADLLTTTYLIWENNEQELSLSEASFSDLISRINEIDEVFFSLEIRSSIYDLRKEKGIICYYNLNDRYHDELLDNIFNSNVK